MAALYFFCLSVGWVYAQIQSIAHWVQPLFQDQISKGRPTIFYVLFKREKSPFFFIFKRKVQHRVKFTSTKQTASWVLSFVVFLWLVILTNKNLWF